MRSVYSTLTASRQLCDSFDLNLPGMPKYAWMGAPKQAGGGTNSVRRSAVLPPCYRRVMLVAYL